jgi:hypothetical protein
MKKFSIAGRSIKLSRTASSINPPNVFGYSATGGIIAPENNDQNRKIGGVPEQSANAVRNDHA